MPGLDPGIHGAALQPSRPTSLFHGSPDQSGDDEVKWRMKYDLEVAPNP
jgi:hypothetical protein